MPDDLMIVINEKPC